MKSPKTPKEKKSPKSSVTVAVQTISPKEEVLKPLPILDAKLFGNGRIINNNYYEEEDYLSPQGLKKDELTFQLRQSLYQILIGLYRLDAKNNNCTLCKIFILSYLFCLHKFRVKFLLIATWNLEVHSFHLDDIVDL